MTVEDARQLQAGDMLTRIGKGPCGDCSGEHMGARVRENTGTDVTLTYDCGASQILSHSQVAALFFFPGA